MSGEVGTALSCSRPRKHPCPNLGTQRHWEQSSILSLGGQFGPAEGNGGSKAWGRPDPAQQPGLNTHRCWELHCKPSWWPSVATRCVDHETWSPGRGTADKDVEGWRDRMCLLQSRAKWSKSPRHGRGEPPPTTHRPRQLRPAHLQESKLTTPQPPSPPRQGAFSLEGSRAEFRLGAPTLPSLLGRVARLSYTFHWRGRLCSLVPWDGHPRALPSAQLPQLPLLLQPCPGSRV